MFLNVTTLASKSRIHHDQSNSWQLNLMHAMYCKALHCTAQNRSIKCSNTCSLGVPFLLHIRKYYSRGSLLMTFQKVWLSGHCSATVRKGGSNRVSTGQPTPASSQPARLSHFSFQTFNFQLSNFQTVNFQTFNFQRFDSPPRLLLSQLVSTKWVKAVSAHLTFKPSTSKLLTFNLSTSKLSSFPSKWVKAVSAHLTIRASLNVSRLQASNSWGTLCIQDSPFHNWGICHIPPFQNP